MEKRIKLQRRMTIPVYNKLVRDKILEIIETVGLNYNARILVNEIQN